MKIGAQLYTVRKACATLDGFAETLKRVADIGYTTVQVSGTCAYEPEWLAEQLKANGLTCNLTHFNLQRILNDTDKVVAEHNVYGCKYIGVGAMPNDYRNTEGAVQFVNEAGAAARRIKELGSTFMYHNHSFEYKTICSNGKTLMEMLSELFKPGEMGFTLDTYWVKDGGYDPVEEIKRLNGRVPCVHFKDMEMLPDGSHRFTWCGNGILDFEKITEALVASGTKYAFIEQDNCWDEDPFDCLKKSYDFLRTIGLD